MLLLSESGTFLHHIDLSRTVDQANMIKREAEKKHVVIVGTSFIGKILKFDQCHAMLQFACTYPEEYVQ